MSQCGSVIVEFAISMPFLVMLTVGTAELPAALDQFTSLQRAVEVATQNAAKVSNLQVGNFPGLVTASGCQALGVQAAGGQGGFGGGAAGGGAAATPPGRHSDIQLAAKSIIDRQLNLGASDLCISSSLDKSGSDKTVTVTANAKISSSFPAFNMKVSIMQSAPYLK